MLKPLAVVLALLLAVAGAYYYHSFYPPTVFKRATQHALDEFSETIATQDRAKIGESLARFLDDSAQIRLEISFISITQPKGSEPVVQAFNKATFITFIDNILYSLKDYDYKAEIEQFKLSPDKKTAAVTFASREWANGVSNYEGVAINMRFSSETTCEGGVTFESERPMLQNAVCQVRLFSAPRPGEERKLLTNPGVMKDVLR